MSTATQHNERSTGQTSGRKPSSDTHVSEADYLAREVADAKAAVSHALADLKAGLKTSADLRLWVRQYPWAVMGAATVTGFAAAAAFTPAKGESVAEKFSRLKESASGASDGAGAPASQPVQTQTTKAAFLNSLFDLAKVLLQSIILATFQNQPQDSVQNVAATDRRQTTTAFS